MPEKRYHAIKASFDAEQLRAEIEAEGFPGFLGICTSGLRVEAVFADELIQSQANTVETILALHDPDPTNPLTRLRAAAKAALDAQQSEQAALLRAVVLAVLAEVNVLRQWVVNFKSATALASSLANFQARVAALSSLPERTPTQARAAIKSHLDAGDADT